MKKTRLALCVGGIDFEYQSIMMKAITERCGELGIQLAAFHCVTNRFVGDRADVGTYNIYSLANFSLFDGLLIISRSINDEEAVKRTIERARRASIPIVSLDLAVEGTYGIEITDISSVELLTDHIIEKHGKRRINFISGMENNFVSQQREDAYKRSLEKHGIPFEPKRLSYGKFSGTYAAEEVEKYYREYNEMPEAFVCANDTMAMQAINKVIELGFRVPEDVAVTGFDGIVMAQHNTTPVTTAKPDYYAMGTLAVDRMMNILGGTLEPTGSESMENKLIFNKSCGCTNSEVRHSNVVFRGLYRRIEENDYYSESIISMIEKITCSTGFDETMSVVAHYVDRFGFGEKFWICLDRDYMSRSDDDVEKTAGASGYSEEIYPAVIQCGDKVRCADKFPSEKLLPLFDEELERYGAIMFMPLHFSDRTIGYAAATFDEKVGETNFHIVNSLLLNIGIAMENSRIQNHLKDLVKQLSDLYIHDSMTGLYNRRGFYTRANDIYHMCRSERRAVMVVSVDIDGMKFINDEYGHIEGDNAIKTVANAILFSSNKNEISARFGGDEFIVAAAALDEKHSETFINSINSYLELYNDTAGKPYKIKVSLGGYIATPGENMSLDEFIRIADENMYTQKRGHSESRDNREGMRYRSRGRS